MRISGNNDFHEGWLAKLLGEPRLSSASEDWLVGYSTAADTPSVAMISRVVSEMRSHGQLIVEP